jgi:hypothetical protein
MRLPKLTGVERMEDRNVKQPGARSVYAQGCNPFQCAGAVVRCLEPCTSGNVGDCIACLGPLYDSCKDCF